MLCISSPIAILLDHVQWARPFLQRRQDPGNCSISHGKWTICEFRGSVLLSACRIIGNVDIQCVICSTNSTVLSNRINIEHIHSKDLSGNDTKGLKKFTAKEVEANSTAASLWVILNGKVYDLTNFDHPGGAHEILEYAGKDITKAFKMAGNFSKIPYHNP